MARATTYLGEKARIAASLINSSHDGPPITPDPENDGFWLVPRKETAWDGALSAPTHLRWSDQDLIAAAIMHAHDGMLVLEGALDDLRDVRP